MKNTIRKYFIVSMAKSYFTHKRWCYMILFYSCWSWNDGIFYSGKNNHDRASWIVWNKNISKNLRISFRCGKQQINNRVLITVFDTSIQYHFFINSIFPTYFYCFLILFVMTFSIFIASISYVNQVVLLYTPSTISISLSLLWIINH